MLKPDCNFCMTCWLIPIFGKHFKKNIFTNGFIAKQQLIINNVIKCPSVYCYNSVTNKCRRLFNYFLAFSSYDFVEV